MIAKHLHSKSGSVSSFGRLGRYISDSQNNGERLGAVTVTNCENTDIRWAIAEVQATQAMNLRARGDKTYHLLISMTPTRSD